MPLEGGGGRGAAWQRVGRWEYVLTDPTVLAIAVVRPAVEARVVEPSWSEKAELSTVVIGKPGDPPALLIGTVKGLVVPSYALVRMAPGMLLGVIRQPPREARWTRPARAKRLWFSRCICGNRPRKCVCGIEEGEMQWVSGLGAWSVVDASGMELALITPRWFFLPSVTTSTPSGARARRHLRAIRDIVSLRPVAWEVVESAPSLDWNAHGLLVALAALCNSRVRGRALQGERWA